MSKPTQKVSSANNTGQGWQGRPFTVLCIVLGILTVVLAWGWLRQTPSQEELYGDTGRFVHEFKTHFLEGKLSWWTPNFMQGGSSAGYFAVSFVLLIATVLEHFFGDPAGIKLLGLLTLSLIHI